MEKKRFLYRGLNDSYFLEEDEIVLVDYKTDRIGKRRGVDIESPATAVRLKLCKGTAEDEKEKSKRVSDLLLCTS